MAQLLIALAKARQAVADEPIDEPRDAGSAEHDSIGQLVHPQSMVLAEVELHQDVEFGEGKVADRHQIQFKPPRDPGVSDKERPPGVVLDDIELWNWIRGDGRFAEFPGYRINGHVRFGSRRNRFHCFETGHLHILAHATNIAHVVA